MWVSASYDEPVFLINNRQIAYQLCHLMSIVSHLEPAWAHAFLRRTRMLDSDFQGDVLAVISMRSDHSFTRSNFMFPY